MSGRNHFGSISPSHSDEAHVEHESSAAAGASIQSKPIRLALACNQCRKRKVRCDAQQPKCRNCSVRGDVCETSDPRKSGDFPAVRRRATKRWQSKTRRAADPALSPAYHSPGAFTTTAVTPNAVISINSVLNPAGAVLDNLVGLASTDVRRASRNSAIQVSSVSPASSSWRTNHSERLGEDHFSWQSRAYQESTEAQIEEVVPDHSVTEQATAESPVILNEAVNTDGIANRTKVRTHLPLVKLRT